MTALADMPMTVSVHIPKTGGASFRDVLMVAFDGQVYFDYRDRPLSRNHAWRNLVARLRGPRLPRGCRCVHGHFLARKYDGRFPSALRAVWLRDPVERLASHYAYWRRTPFPDNSLCRRLLQENWTLLDFARQPAMRELQTRFLQGVDLDGFAFVGVTEAYARGIRLFQRIFCPDSDLDAALQNANPERPAQGYDLEASERREIARLNRRDAALYDVARKRFEALCARCGA